MPSAPSPFRLRNRLRWAGVFAILALILLWLAWWRIAEHQLASRLQAIRAAGEPIEQQDFAQPQLPPEHNAATYYRQAFGAMTLTVPNNSVFLNEKYPYYSQASLLSAAKAVAANVPLLARARQAASFPQAQWGFGPGSQWMAQSSRLINGTRRLGDFLADAALDAHFSGDDREAIERLFDLFALAGAVSQHMSSPWEASEKQLLAMERLEIILADLQIAAPSSAATQRAVDSNRLRQMIDLLLDEQTARRQLRSALQVRRVEKLDMLQTLQSSATVLYPMLTAETTHMLDQTVVEQQATEQEDLPHALALVDALRTPERTNAAGDDVDPERSSRVFSSVYANQAEYLIRNQFRLRTERRVAAAAIAIRLFRAEHGRWPAKLQELVPQYLPAVPTDLFLPGHVPINYKIFRGTPVGAGDRPMLFFAVTASARPTLPPDDPSFGWMEGLRPLGQDIQWRDLAHWWSPPATQAAGH
jgi:hypothetical protein